MKTSRIYIYTALVIAGLTFCLNSQANTADPTNLIMNANFTATTGSTHNTQTQLNSPSGTNLPGFAAGANIGPWTASGLVFLFGPGPMPSGTNADSNPGAANHFNASPTNTANGFCLWGPGSCGGSVSSSVQSPPNRLMLGPNGHNFLALDGALTDPAAIKLEGGISQTIMGLKKGIPVTVEFNWAAAQQVHFTGTTTETLQVSLCPTSGTCPGGDIKTTVTLTNPYQHFQQWREGDLTFTPTSSTEKLSFLGIGTPAKGAPGIGPPFVLLDGGVELTPVPEPATWSLFGIGFAAIAGIALYRRQKRVSAA